MYLAPTRTWANGLVVFNSWLSLSVPAAVFCGALAVRLYSAAQFSGVAIAAVVAGSAVWWLFLAAFLKWTFFRVLYVMDMGTRFGLPSVG